MKLTKRLIACILVLALIPGLSAVAFAEADITTGSPWLACLDQIVDGVGDDDTREIFRMEKNVDESG